jgi:hypothetical protein
MKRIKKGDYVVWKWASGLGRGLVQDVRTEMTAIESKGKTIIRSGSPDNPAIIIEDHNGVSVLKRANEVDKVS